MEDRRSTENKGSADRHGYLLAFAFGVALMVIVYIFFERAAKGEYRTRAPDAAGPSDSEIGAYAPTIHVSHVEEAAPLAAAFLGVEIMPVDPVIAEQLDVPAGKGVLVNSVVPGSPAQVAGLERGDVIVALNSRTVKDVNSLREIMEEFEPGDRVRIIRSGKKDLTYALLVEAPATGEAAQNTPPSDSPWGVSLSPVSSALRETLGIPPGVQGIAILSVVPGAAADEAGLMPGDVIASIDGTLVSDMEDFFTAISSAEDDTVLLDVYSQGRRRYVPIDSSGVADRTQTQTSLQQRIFSIFTGGSPFSSEEDDEEGPKGGKFAREDLELTADTTGFNRPSTVPGEANTGGPLSGSTGFNRPSTVPGETNTGGGTANDIVFFTGLLVAALIYLAYREFHRPPELDKSR